MEAALYQVVRHLHILLRYVFICVVYYIHRGLQIPYLICSKNSDNLKVTQTVQNNQEHGALIVARKTIGLVSTLQQ